MEIKNNSQFIYLFIYFLNFTLTPFFLFLFLSLCTPFLSPFFLAVCMPLSPLLSLSLSLSLSVPFSPQFISPSPLFLPPSLSLSFSLSIFQSVMITEALSKVPLLDGLTDAQLAKISDCVEILPYPGGTYERVHSIMR